MKPKFKSPGLSQPLATVFLILACTHVQGAVTLEASDAFTTSGAANGNLSITGDMSIWKGLDLGTSAGNTALSAIQIDFYNSGSLLKTGSFDLTDPSAAFIWRDNLVGTARNKMSLDTANVLTLFNSSGSAGILLDPNTGKITLPAGNGTATGSGIYFGTNTTATLFATPSGAAIFPSQVTLQNGLAITSTTAATNSTTGALTIAGGLGVGMDAYINGIRVGRGAGNVVSNTVIGNGGLQSNTTGSYNSATGISALFSNTTGNSNSATGAYALRYNTTGYSNSATGVNALFYNTTGIRNSATGFNVLYCNTTGSFNSAMGDSALHCNTTGIFNTAIGLNAHYSNTTGSSNLATGVYANYSNTTGSSNSAIGSNALFSNMTGNLNVAVGSSAGRYQSNGVTALSDPKSSVYIGANSRGKDNNDNNSIVIGANAIGEGANTTVIGNASTLYTHLHGDFLRIGNNYAVVSDDNGNTSLSEGYAFGDYSVGMAGGTASGVCSLAASLGATEGEGSTALSGGYSIGFCAAAIAGGYAVSYGSVALGSNNTDNGNPGEWIEIDPVLTVGNGGEIWNGLPQSNAITTLKNGQTTLTNKAWKFRDTETIPATADPSTATTDSGGEALVVEGHTRLKGKVIIEQPQGDISMGIYGGN